MNLAHEFDYGSLPPGYYDAAYQRGKGIQSKWHHLKFAHFRAAMGGCRCHLDIACGPGTFISTLPRSVDSVGVDIAAPQIAYARSVHAAPNRRFESIEPGALPFTDGSFDVVTMIELIEHLPREEAVALLAEARRVAGPNGKVLVSTPNYRSFWPVLEYLVGRLSPVDYSDQHINRYDRCRLHDDLHSAGFASFEVTGYMLAAPFAAALGWRFSDWISRLEPALLVDRLGLLLFAEANP